MEEREWFSRNFELMRTKTLSNQRKVQLATIMLKSQVCESLCIFNCTVYISYTVAK